MTGYIGMMSRGHVSKEILMGCRRGEAGRKR